MPTRDVFDVTGRTGGRPDQICTPFGMMLYGTDGLTYETSMIEAVDLFCGAGGLTCGLEAAGIRVTAGIDIDGACRYPFTENHPGATFLERDVAGLTAAEVESFWSPGATRLLAGCAPCQPFSTYSRGVGSKHGKWAMLDEFARLVGDTKPHLVTMENVPGLQRADPFQQFLAMLLEQGFHVQHSVLNAADFGVPQRRKRLVLIASRLGRVEMPERTHAGPSRHITVRAAVEDLRPLSAGESDLADPLHRASALSGLNIRRIRASRPGGTWKDWPIELVANCHRKISGSHSGGVYGRMEWDKPAPTMTTLCMGFGNGRFGHPIQDRAISLREAAIFQSFPREYRFSPTDVPLQTRQVARLIGNAVPPKLAEAVGRQLKVSLGP